MAEHRVAIALLILGQLIYALLGADFFGVLPSKASFSLHSALPVFQPYFGFEMAGGVLVEIWLVGLFLKSLSVKPTRQAYINAFSVCAALTVGLLVLFLSLKSLMPLVESPIASFGVTLAGIAIAIWLSNRLFCIVCQTLVDETPNLSRSLQGVSGRLARVWLVHILGTILMLSILALLDQFVRAPSFSTSQFGDLLPQFREIVALLLGYGSNIFIAALSVVWFLSPIHRPPEESTTWVVPEGSLQS
jgi:hypothetical protein